MPRFCFSFILNVKRKCLHMVPHVIRVTRDPVTTVPPSSLSSRTSMQKLQRLIIRAQVGARQLSNIDHRYTENRSDIIYKYINIYICN